MSLACRELEDREEIPGLNRESLLNLQRLRWGGRRPRPRAQQKMSLFWQVFGGTILSIVALVVLTAYNQLTSAQADLRRDMNQVQVDQVKKDELNTRLTVVWNSIKGLQGTSTSLVSLNEHAKILDGNIGNQLRSAEEQHKDLQRKVEELSQRVQILAERLVALETTQRVSRSESDTGKPHGNGRPAEPPALTAARAIDIPVRTSLP
jgi:TolA-binding protein